MSRNLARKLTATAVAALGAGALVMGGSGAANATIYSQPTEFCASSAQNPYIPFLQSGAHALVNQSVQPGGGADESPISGQIDLQLRNNPVFFLTYDQAINFSWSNIDTGKSGNVGPTTIRVQGEMATARFGNIETGPGLVSIIANTTNHAWGNTYTTGQCGGTFTVR